MIHAAADAGFDTRAIAPADDGAVTAARYSHDAHGVVDGHAGSRFQRWLSVSRDEPARFRRFVACSPAGRLAIFALAARTRGLYLTNADKRGRSTIRLKACHGSDAPDGLRDAASARPARRSVFIPALPCQALPPTLKVAVNDMPLVADIDIPGASRDFDY